MSSLWSASQAGRAPAKKEKKQVEPRLCTSIAAATLREMAGKASAALSLGSDLVELRVDKLTEHNDIGEVKSKLSHLAQRSVITVRSAHEGGGFGGSDVERLETISVLAETRPAYVDIELSTAKKNPGWLKSLPEGVEKIISWHDFAGTPALRKLRAIRDEALRYGSLAKVITTATAADDNLRTLSLCEEKPGKVVAFCMGELGIISRVLSMRLGAPLAYASIPAEAVAPGQLSLPLMQKLRSMVV